MKLRHLVSIVCVFALPSFCFAAPASHSAAITVSDKQINLNTADIKLLTKSAKGIGAKRAEAIVKYRENHGKFKSVNDLVHVPGFGQKFVNAHLDELQQTFTVQ